MNFNKDRLKSYLLRDKGFLKELYEGSNYLSKKHRLQVSEDSELNTLIKYLYFYQGLIFLNKKLAFLKYILFLVLI